MVGHAAGGADRVYDGYRGLFLTTKGSAKIAGHQSHRRSHPGVLAVAEAEADRLVAGEARIRPRWSPRQRRGNPGRGHADRL